MSQVKACPKCSAPVAVPDSADAHAHVRCPICHAEYALYEAADHHLPEFHLVGAHQQPIVFGDLPGDADSHNTFKFDDQPSVLPLTPTEVDWHDAAPLDLDANSDAPLFADHASPDSQHSADVLTFDSSDQQHADYLQPDEHPLTLQGDWGVHSADDDSPATHMPQSHLAESEETHDLQPLELHEFDLDSPLDLNDSPHSPLTAQPVGEHHVQHDQPIEFGSLEIGQFEEPLEFGSLDAAGSESHGLLGHDEHAPISFAEHTGLLSGHTGDAAPHGEAADHELAAEFSDAEPVEPLEFDAEPLDFSAPSEHVHHPSAESDDGDFNFMPAGDDPSLNAADDESLVGADGAEHAFEEPFSLHGDEDGEGLNFADSTSEHLAGADHQPEHQAAEMALVGAAAGAATAKAGADQKKAKDKKAVVAKPKSSSVEKGQRRLGRLMLVVSLLFLLAVPAVFFGALWIGKKDTFGLKGILPEFMVPPELRTKNFAKNTKPTPVVPPAATNAPPSDPATNPDAANPDVTSPQNGNPDTATPGKTPVDPLDPLAIPDLGNAPTNADGTPKTPSEGVIGAMPDLVSKPDRTPKSVDSKPAVDPLDPLTTKPAVDPLDPLAPPVKPDVTPNIDPLSDPLAPPPKPVPLKPDVKPEAVPDPLDPLAPKPDVKPTVDPLEDPLAPKPDVKPAVDPLDPLAPKPDVKPAVDPLDSVSIGKPEVKPSADPLNVDPLVSPVKPETTKPDVVKPDVTEVKPAIDPTTVPMPAENVKPDLLATPKSRVKDAPRYNADDLAKAGQAAADANAKLLAVDANNTAELKKARAGNYISLCHLSEVITFLASTSENRAPWQVFEKLAADSQRAEEIGALGGFWLNAPARKAGNDHGIVLAGKVKAIKPQAELFEISLTLFGSTPKDVTVVTDVRPQYDTNAAIMVLGSSVSKPADNIAGYKGNQDEVVWSGMVYTLAAPR